MQACLYLDGAGAFLAERWLRAHGARASVVLYAERDALPLAQSLQSRFPMIVSVRDADSGEPAPAPRIVVPLHVDVSPLEHQYPVRLPQLAPCYDTFARLWRRGFREFECFHLGGGRVLRVPHLLDAFQDKHKGRRCFVVGNGPSLNEIDMTRLRDEVVLGSNRCYLGFQEWGFVFPYWGVSDKLQIEVYGPEYEERVPRDTVTFFPFEYLPLLDFDGACPVRFDWPREANRQFSNVPGRLFLGYTVTYMLLQIAAVMGCDPIILIGVDHRYDLRKTQRLRRMVRLCGRWLARHYDHATWYKAGRAAAEEVIKARRAAGKGGPRRFWESKDAAHPTHFDARYAAGEEKRFLMPRPLDAEKDFACAARWAEEHGVRILNATPGSALTAFPMVAFHSLF